jgi:hypothetical protein
MGISSKIRTAFRGRVPLSRLPQEALRRKRLSGHLRSEKRDLDKIAATPARLSLNFGSLSEAQRLEHFRRRERPCLWPGIDSDGRIYGPAAGESERSQAAAREIIRNSTWELAGFQSLRFDTENVWRRDPISGHDWGLGHHPEIELFRADGSDVRVLWELNRFGHAVTLALAFSATGDEEFAETFFSHLERWMEQNPFGRGANWASAMEAALRSVNVLSAFDILRHSAALTSERLEKALKFFDHHGKFIFDNSEFSYIATSNHYLSDVAGLFWIGTLMPELEHAAKWRALGLSEMLAEMDKQILPDGAHFEASTGYHRFVTEMFLVTFILAERNGITIAADHKEKLRLMVEYLAAMTQPGGRMPLIGDCDGSRFLTVAKREGDEAKFILDLSTVFLDDPSYKISREAPPEIFWLFGSDAVGTFESAASGDPQTSAGFRDSGAAVLRAGDLYLHLNASDCGIDGRGSHGHNDALSIEVAAFGRTFIIDPGSYVYNLDRRARHLFRSTAYHSTVMIDGAEQNHISEDEPFVSGNDATPRLVSPTAEDEIDFARAEHFGYRRLAGRLIHRRSIELDKTARLWTLTDEFTGRGRHEFAFSFHIAPQLEVRKIGSETVALIDDQRGSLIIDAADLGVSFTLSDAFCSRNYGHREPSQILRGTLSKDAPLTARFLLITARPGESLEERLAFARSLPHN